jgi:hypothetical protein
MRSSYFGSTDIIFQYVACSKGPEENVDRSYLTILSKPGLMFGLINIVGKYALYYLVSIRNELFLAKNKCSLTTNVNFTSRWEHDVK